MSFIAELCGRSALFPPANFCCTLCWHGHSFFPSWRLVFRVVRHCALLVQLYFHIVHDFVMVMAWFDGHIMLFVVDLSFRRGRASGATVPGRFPVWILPLLLGCAHAKKFVMFALVCLLCLCAGQASSAGKVL
jgi:hypothetical protein